MLIKSGGRNPPVPFTEPNMMEGSGWQRGNVLLLLTPPHDLGYMSWTTGWSAFGLLHDPAFTTRG